MKSKKHYILMVVTLLIAGVCGYWMPKVKVNSDMTLYLPDESQMRQGLEVLNTEFTSAQLAQADVHALFPGLQPEDRKTIQDELAAYADVQHVTYRVSKDSLYTLFDLVVPKSVDQKALGQQIRADHGREVVVETSQDGATPPVSALIIAGGLILFILLIMTQSWLDPVLILLVAGVAVVINIGTNALLPSVSITTNYIVAILQLVLSLDYSIILMNRYRQELKTSPRLDALNGAVRHSVKPILSSALTTVVGLLMLAFMRLKIGLDMGFVLAKGVVCSLICTFTLLPALLLIFHKVLLKSAKKTLLLPTDRLGWFVTHHKVSFAIAAVALFGVAFYFSLKTPIYFSTNGESRIAEIFPKTNTTVVLYDTHDEQQVFELADSLQDEHLLALVSYPTLLKQQYTASELIGYIQQLSREMADYLPSNVGHSDLLREEFMRWVYYMRSSAADTLRIPFASLMNFVQTDCVNNPMFASVIDANMRSQVELLNTLLDTPQESPQNVPAKPAAAQKSPDSNNGAHADSVRPSNAPVKQVQPTEQSPWPTVIQTSSASVDRVNVRDFMVHLDALYNNDDTRYLKDLTDSVRLTTEMNVREMAAFIGSTNSQTKMVYSFSKQGKQMTPLEYVHFLTDDLFERKALANLVNEEQKQGLRARMHIMDLAVQNGSTSPSQLAEWLRTYGLPVNEQQIRAWMQPAQPRVEELATAPAAEESVQPVSEPLTPWVAARPKQKTQAERRAELFDYLLHSPKAYTAEQATKYFNRLGQNMSPETVNMLYSYYGSQHCYNDSLTMSPEELLTYVGDTLIAIPQVAAVVDSATRAGIAEARVQLDSVVKMFANDSHSMMVVVTDYPDESDSTYAYIDRLHNLTDNLLIGKHYLIGESAMFSEMKNGFDEEMLHITLLTILAIFLIVAISFRSIVVPTILVVTVMTAVYVNVIFSGIFSGQMLYLAYLIAQSILMGATIDYGILYTNYYKEHRHTLSQYAAAQAAYKGSIRTVMTSGLIMVLGPGAMAVLVDDVAISAIVGCISVGAFVAILLILTVLPGTLVAFDRWVVGGNQKRFSISSLKKNETTVLPSSEVR